MYFVQVITLLFISPVLILETCVSLIFIFNLARLSPFRVSFKTDENEIATEYTDTAPYGTLGFSLGFMQSAC
jgi:hypothetical protein